MTKRTLAAAAAALALTACATPGQVAQGPSTATAALGETVRIGDTNLVPLALVEDSRCPATVQCIHAGTVRLQLRLDEPAGSRTATIALGQPIAAGASWLHLTAACPNRTTPAAIPNSRYRFRFALLPREITPELADDCE